MKIYVTQNDIDTGIKRSYDSCPVALAVSRVVNRGKSFVGKRIIVPYVAGRHIDTPESVSKFVDDFDFDRPVSPFIFELKLN